MATLQQILGARNLTGMVQTIKSGLPTVVPPEFLNPTGMKITGNTGEYFKVEGTRQLAQLVQYGSASKRVGLRGIKQKTFTAIHTAENIQMRPQDYQNLLDPDNGNRQELAIAEIARQTAEFKRRLSNLRIASTTRALLQGVLYFDSNGGLLTDSSGSMFGIDYEIPSSNKTTGLQMDGSTAIITASWATASTDIFSQVRVLKKTAIRRSGYPITTALVGTNVPGYIAKNDYAKYWLARNPGKNQQFLDTGEIPDGFLGLNWINVGDAFFEKADGTIVDQIDADGVVFLPDPSPDWFEMVEGSSVVPKQIGLAGADLMSASGASEIVYGMSSYAKIIDDPVTAVQIAQDTFLPLIKVPGAVYQLDTTP